ncbi:carbohydrate binding domain-containing protein [Reinekea sp.]|jgi:hypothetical protein|uniref:carbohydrate binding domain-containing protein n=1 Tax=Reinekea sp. TaxID=1970455 RepID=UPI002A7F5399|nr:carbohydrate binding domain-containing protein [Reinekea sp.]
MLKVIGWLFLSIGLSGVAFGGGSLSQVDASEQTITVYYSTDWEDSYLQYRGDEDGWSELPGREMVSPFLGFKQTIVAASTLEFAFNNGDGDWVKHSNGNNFTISHPGTYVVADDRVQLISHDATEILPVIKLHYKTDWSDPKLHYQANQLPWSGDLGESMANSADYANHRYFEIAASSLEFAVHQDDDWDNGQEGDNYQITVPGEYYLADGQLTRIQAHTVPDINWLSSVFAETGAIRPTNEGFEITLQGIRNTTMLFTDRPVREADVIKTQAFFDQWSANFGDNPPNAVFSGSYEDTIEEAVFTLYSPIYDGASNSVTFQATSLLGSEQLHEDYSEVHLFIDGIFDGLFYPDNSKRERRMKELNADASTISTQLTVVEGGLRTVITGINVEAQEMYGDIGAEIPEIKPVTIANGYTLDVIEDVGSILLYGYVTATLTDVAAAYLLDEGFIGAAAFAELVGLPFECTAAATGVGIIVVVGVDMILDAFTGAKKRSKLRGAIHSLVPYRLQIKKAELASHELLNILNETKADLATLKSIGYSKADLDALLKGQLSSKVESRVKTITDGSVATYLAAYDRGRGSWTHEDH